MRFVKVVYLASFLAACLLIQASASSEKKPDKAGKNHKVEMMDDEFKPKEITIEVGDTITWVNKGEKKHTATADKKDDPNFFDTKDVLPTKSSDPVEFKKEGTVPYHCDHHKKMVGTITVKAKAKP